MRGQTKGGGNLSLSESSLICSLRGVSLSRLGPRHGSLVVYWNPHALIRAYQGVSGRIRADQGVSGRIRAYQDGSGRMRAYQDGSGRIRARRTHPFGLLLGEGIQAVDSLRGDVRKAMPLRQ